ncbi:MAG: hypothetical protein LBF12_05800 [Christensenellaceae bacterium]|jgi:hypothetical protein|nr:hypothetical protein [Christensenellaceae bacterium]
MQIGLRKAGDQCYLAVFKDDKIGSGEDAKVVKKFVRNIGPLAEFDDGKPDYIKRLRESFRIGKCIIPEIQDLAEEQAKSLVSKIEQNIKEVEKTKTTLQDSATEQPKNVIPRITYIIREPEPELKNIGYIVLNTIYESLGLDRLTTRYKGKYNFKYDLRGLFKLLVLGKILDPSTKAATFQSRDKYFFSSITGSRRPCEMYKSLDIIANKSLELQTKINDVIEKSTISRNKEICYFGVTNYCFESTISDNDISDEKLNKTGNSKKSKTESTIQIGLFLDNNGIPLSFKTFSGYTMDHKAIQSLLDMQKNQLGYHRILLIADADINSNFDLRDLVEMGDGYLVSKSLETSDRQITEWALDENDYIFNADKTIKTKSIIRQIAAENETSSKSVIDEKVVSVWTQSLYKKEKKSLDDLIWRLKDDIRRGNVTKISPKHDRYIKKVVLNNDDGEITDYQTTYELNEEAINQAYMQLGYRTILTSETNNSDMDILHKYYELSRIEETFKVIKSEFDKCSSNVSVDQHIKAHFTIAFVALTILRLLQYKVLKHLGKPTALAENRESGLSTQKIIDALNDWKIGILREGMERMILKPFKTDLEDDIKLIANAIGSNSSPEELIYASYIKLRMKMNADFVL